jgi:hypothetical protein
MKKTYAILPVLAIAVVLVSGCTGNYDGSPPKMDQGRIDAVTASATAFLAGAQGQEVFAGGTLGIPTPVFDNNRSFNHWILPVTDSSGKYMGFMTSSADSFTLPNGGVTTYPVSRIHLYSKTREGAYATVLNNTAYTAAEIKDPYVVTLENLGYHWATEIVSNGKFISKIYVPVSIIEPHPDDMGK